jgi:hypothetical protein
MTPPGKAGMLASLSALVDRELETLRREVEAYPDDDALWVSRPEVPNSGGILVRHLCGNLQHFVGGVLGGSGYRRERTAEFGAPPWSRPALLEEIARTRRASAAALGALSPERLDDTYPETVAGRQLATGDFLLHLGMHLAYHLGQVDYHRRLVAGGGPVGAMAIPAMATARPA